MHFTLQLLKEGLRDGLDPVLIGHLAFGIMSSAKTEPMEPGGSWVGSVSDLFEISTALQRIEGTRAIGTELFEKMLEAEIHGLGEQVSRFDRNRFA